MLRTATPTARITVLSRKHIRSSRPVCVKAKGNDKIPTPYELYDETVKKMSEPALKPLLQELEKTNESLNKIVHILEYKVRKMDSLVSSELMEKMNK